MDIKKVYFPNLNGLRFIAAFLVIIHHIELFKSSLSLNNYYAQIPFIGIIGKLGVVLFFVLSGFLITYLLLTEENNYKQISIKSFYIRRILRIWPLYFLIIISALLILPNFGSFTIPGYGLGIVHKNLFLKIILFILFLPNLEFAVLGLVPYASQTWSIGTEEQYYLVWPVILKFFKKHRLLLMIFLTISFMFITRMLASPLSDILPYKKGICLFWLNFNIDCMAIGAFFGILLFQKNKILKIFLNKYIFIFVIVLLLVCMIKGVYLPDYCHCEFYAFLFGILILNFAASEKQLISLENNAFNYLGKISYGLYMYHPIGIILSIKLMYKFTNFNTNWVLYPLSIILTIIIAAISYKYFETIFLKFKIHYSKILSGDDLKIISKNS